MRLIDADALIETVHDITHHPDNYMTVREIEYTVEREPTVGGWISVKERLPETRHAVLVYTPHHKNIWAASMHEDGNWYIWTPGVRALLDPDWNGPITHWRPLPEPPKEVVTDATEA